MNTWARSVRLTKAQIAALRELEERGMFSGYSENDWRSYKALERRGLIAATPSRAGGFHITREGQRALVELGLGELEDTLPPHVRFYE